MLLRPNRRGIRKGGVVVEDASGSIHLFLDENGHSRSS